MNAQFYKSFEGLNSRFISEDVKTGLGFTMDAEIIVDSFAKPLQVFTLRLQCNYK